MFAKPPPAPIPQKSASEAAPAPEAGVTPSETSSGFVEVTHADAEPEDLPIPPIADEIPVHEPPELADFAEPTITLTPSKDQLTQENVEHLPDTAHPAPVGTAASTVESSRGPDSMTPSVAGQSSAQAPIGRPIMGGFATTAYKATGTPGRSASFQRRLMEQQEAVVMPGNHLVDRTAVQFGSLGLNGDALDVDEDREEAETRTQPPGHSPVAAPRASLPPVPRQPPAPTDPLHETPATQKPAPGLPPAPQQQQPFAQQSPNTLASQTQQGAQGQGYNQFSRYGQANLPSDSSAQKAYDPFGQQHPQGQQSAFDAYASQSQAPSQQPQAQTHLPGFSSAANDYSQYYTADQRAAYQQYYNSYGQPAATSQQDAGATQQRTGSAFGAAAGEPAFPASQSQQVRPPPFSTPSSQAREGRLITRDLQTIQRSIPSSIYSNSSGIIISPATNQMTQQTQSRYGDAAQQSGHTTPNPALGAQQQPGAQAQSQQAQHQHQQPHTQGQQHSAYGNYQQHPYYQQSPYYNAYMNQYSPYNQQSFAAPFGGKGGMYNQPHHGYSQNSYDQHSSSPANTGGFPQSSMHGRESALTSGLGEYARSGSAQPSQTQQPSGTGAFGGINDPFSRAQGAFAGQNQPYGQQAGQQASGDDALKPFADAKSGSGPSPSALGQPGRPGSATNTTGQAAQSGLPPPQSLQQGFGSYPGAHLGQMGQTSQYGGALGGLGGGHTAGAQSHQAGGYGAYGAGAAGAGGNAGFSNSYGSYGGRGGGWGGNYGGH
jgi:hypothetical protein